MHLNRHSIAILATIAATHCTPALALADWGFVSISGSDSNGCAITSPCRTFQGAYNKTNAGGAIVVLTAGSFGIITIDHGISIVNDSGGTAAIFAQAPQPYSGNAITISAGPNDSIYLRGLTLDGDLVHQGLGGIVFRSGKSLTVEDCSIKNFVENGISFAVPSSSALSVSRTIISNTQAEAVFINNYSSGAVQAAFTHLVMTKTGGLRVRGVGPTDATVSDSVAANGGMGFEVDGASAPVNLTITRSTSANNIGDALVAFSPSATLRLSQSTITGNVVGWDTQLGGSVLSYGDNVIDGNASGDAAPPGIAKK